jgi:Siphovirus Gp157
MADPRAPTAWQIEQAMSAWQQIQATLEQDPDLDLDEQAIWQALGHEGVRHPEDLLSRLTDALVWTIRRKEEADALRVQMRDRRDRYLAREDAFRATIQSLMEALEKSKHRTALASLSIREARPGVRVTDANALPDEYVKIIRQPLLELIHDHIDNGVIIPGAELSNPALVLYVRKN